MQRDTDAGQGGRLSLGPTGTSRSRVSFGQVGKEGGPEERGEEGKLVPKLFPWGVGEKDKDDLKGQWSQCPSRPLRGLPSRFTRLIRPPDWKTGSSGSGSARYNPCYPDSLRLFNRRG